MHWRDIVADVTINKTNLLHLHRRSAWAVRRVEGAAPQISTSLLKMRQKMELSQGLNPGPLSHM